MYIYENALEGSRVLVHRKLVGSAAGGGTLMATEFLDTADLLHGFRRLAAHGVLLDTRLRLAPGARGRARISLHQGRDRAPVSRESPYAGPSARPADRRPFCGGRDAGRQADAGRPAALAQFLVSEGMPPTRLATTGFGEYQSLVPGNDPEFLRSNRRIELRLNRR